MTDKELLAKIEEQLRDWASDSIFGGWSTHQVGPQRKLADEIALHLYRSKPEKKA